MRRNQAANRRPRAGRTDKKAVPSRERRSRRRRKAAGKQTPRRRRRAPSAVRDTNRTLRKGDADKIIVRWAAALGHVVRLSLLRHLRQRGTASYAELCNVAGQTAGPLYHHLRTLEGAGLLARTSRDVYEVSPAGRRILDGWVRMAKSMGRQFGR